ncbi:SDR family oxidoreductase [Membranicola marinus]|uniref:SDR family oxidoreductase n=1 Tax=Membranihabitans marinus TaxID=1227546 RepID=A0A953HKI9_9BACT|nr:SDR family oxidoreductase [Membranihabitans marinus]MBY5957367.1 SDR family oxidoreductase [Membranihabitans marinus]
MKKVIIAGANSFVASHFVHKLLSQDYHVVALVRGSSEASAVDRMQEALEDTTLDPVQDSGTLTVIDYTLLAPNFSLSEETIASIFEGHLDYYHFAASLKFDFRSKEEIFDTNINGLKNALNIFQKYASEKGRFFFISTAYSCGVYSDVFEEKFYPEADISQFRNYYEQSKRLAENALQEFMAEYPINAHVIRLSQVVGNSRSGVTRTSYGIFDFAKRVHALAQQYPNQKIRIHADPDATQNLISIDTVIADLMEVVATDEVPVIMNFVANHPMSNRQIIRSISDLTSVELVPEKDIQKEDMNELERMVLAGMAFTGNYIDTDIDFDTRQRDKVISPLHREVNESSVFAMLAYYLDNITEKSAVKSQQ